MTDIHYIKDTKKFWQARGKSRSALDKKRASASLSEKVRVAEKLRTDAGFLKSGRVVSSKH